MGLFELGRPIWHFLAQSSQPCTTKLYHFLLKVYLLSVYAENKTSICLIALMLEIKTSKVKLSIIYKDGNSLSQGWGIQSLKPQHNYPRYLVSDVL